MRFLGFKTSTVKPAGLGCVIQIRLQYAFAGTVRGGRLIWLKTIYPLLQQPGSKKLKLAKIELIYKAKKFKVPPFIIPTLKIKRQL